MSSKIYRWLRSKYIVISLCLATVLPAVADNNNLFRPTDGWEVHGQHGVIHVSGSFNLKPMRISYEKSSNQSVSLGNLSFSDSNSSEQVMQPIPFQIEVVKLLASSN
ncbi:hypothetical protein AB6F61_12870 [Providencia hangzhouensis]|uniref:hypothetical protein n=1 Tax=Providencia hangzhouensis TaxID=3031799 RepID=UPI0034DD31C1